MVCSQGVWTVFKLCYENLEWGIIKERNTAGQSQLAVMREGVIANNCTFQ
jgi:hypothetical protein